MKKIEEANNKALEKILSAQPFLIDLKQAKEVMPVFKGHKKILLHAGPPIQWEHMCGPMRGAVIGAILYEGWVDEEKSALELAEKGEIAFFPCHNHSAVGPMAGIISPSMPVWVVKEKTSGNFSFATLNEGLGKVLRYGAYSKEVINRLHWMEKKLFPVLKEALAIKGEINLKILMAQALQMGDECHNRNKAATSLFIREVAPSIIKTSATKEEKAQVLEFINQNDHFFLNLSMAACKATMDTAEGIPYSTIITAMARNGTEFGIRISGLAGKWFTAQANFVEGLYFPGYSKAEAARDLGDSAITETAGLGGFAMAAAPAIVQFVGGSLKEAINFTLQMYEITVRENQAFQIPALNFRGTPTGIDLRRIIETNILPIINTGIAHKEAGIGQIGAGLVRPPLQCFEEALIAFSKSL